MESEMTSEEIKRFKAFEKSKIDRIGNLDFEIKSLLNSRFDQDPDPKTHLSSALWTIAKGTRYEEYAHSIITSLCPEYFEP